MTDHAAPHDVDGIAGRLVAFLNGEIMAADASIGPDDDLEVAGVDSMALLQVLLFVERTFGFWIPEDELTDEVTATARSLAAHVAARARR